MPIGRWISKVMSQGQEKGASARSTESGQEITVLNDGQFEYRFVVHSSKERNRAQRLFDKEKGTIAWLARELRPDDVFYDIGANIGIYTIFGAHRIGAGGAVFAFEPHIPNANSLLQNIFLNGQEKKVQLITSALTNTQRYGKFNYQSVLASSSISQFDGSSYEGEEFKPVFTEVKNACSIDFLCSTGVIPPPDIIKIDVDGLDFEVLDGMRGLLTSPQRPRSFQVELGSDSKSKILQMCSDTGYVLKEKHWTAAGLDFIAQGNDPEAYPHYGIYYHSDAR